MTEVVGGEDVPKPDPDKDQADVDPANRRSIPLRRRRTGLFGRRPVGRRRGYRPSLLGRCSTWLRTTRGSTSQEGEDHERGSAGHEGRRVAEDEPEHQREDDDDGQPDTRQTDLGQPVRGVDERDLLPLSNSSRCAATGATTSAVESVAIATATRNSVRSGGFSAVNRCWNGRVSRNPDRIWIPVWVTRSSCSSSSQLRSARSVGVSSRSDPSRCSATPRAGRRPRSGPPRQPDSRSRAAHPARKPSASPRSSGPCWPRRSPRTPRRDTAGTLGVLIRVRSGGDRLLRLVACHQRRGLLEVLNRGQHLRQLTPQTGIRPDPVCGPSPRPRCRPRRL